MHCTGAGGRRCAASDLVVEAEGPGRWRIRSWQWRGDAWRPAIARAVVGAGGIAVSGKIDAASRAEVMGRLAI